MNPQSDNVNDYLNSSEYIDHDDAMIRQKAEELAAMSVGKSELIENTYHFVRDEIGHSYFSQGKAVALKASEVLRDGAGVCFSKANLLAALLRANEIPTGICYKRYSYTDGEEKHFCIHALNAVYLGGLIKWIRLDVRGSNLSVNNEVALDKMILDINSRDEIEVDFETIYCEPLPITMETLENNRTPFAEAAQQQ